MNGAESGYHPEETMDADQGENNELADQTPREYRGILIGSSLEDLNKAENLLNQMGIYSRRTKRPAYSRPDPNIYFDITCTPEEYAKWNKARRESDSE